MFAKHIEMTAFYHTILKFPEFGPDIYLTEQVGLKIAAAAETTLTANQPRDAWEARKLRWGTTEVVERGVSNDAQVGQRFFLDPTDEALTVTINAMEVKTYLVRLA